MKNELLTIPGPGQPFIVCLIGNAWIWLFAEIRRVPYELSFTYSFQQISCLLRSQAYIHTSFALFLHHPTLLSWQLFPSGLCWTHSTLLYFRFFPPTQFNTLDLDLNAERNLSQCGGLIPPYSIHYHIQDVTPTTEQLSGPASYGPGSSAPLYAKATRGDTFHCEL